MALTAEEEPKKVEKARNTRSETRATNALVFIFVSPEGEILRRQDDVPGGYAVQRKLFDEIRTERRGVAQGKENEGVHGYGE